MKGFSSLRGGLLAGVVPMGLLVATAPALAQSKSAASAETGSDFDASGDIIVTAQKRAESISKVPLSITALSGDELEKRQVTSLDDIQKAVPGLTVSIQNGVPRLYIRGIGLNSFVIGADSSSSFNVNGVYVGRPSSQLGSFFDLERIEVLRGPQGTLYGRNATGGAINLITRKPSRDFGGDVDISVGNYNAIELNGGLNVPITENGDWRLRVAGQVITRDGFARNRTLQQDIDDESRQALRGTLVYDSGQQFRATFVAEYSHQNDQAYPIVGFGPYPGARLLGTLPGAPFEGQGPIGTRDSYGDIDNRYKRENIALTGTLEYDLSDSLSLASITGYRRYNRVQNFDTDTTSVRLGPFKYDEKSRQFSEEIQARYTSDRLKGLVGLYYYREKIPANILLSVNVLDGFNPLASAPVPPLAGRIFLSDLANPGVAALVRYEQNGSGKISAYSAFTQWTWEVFDRLKLTGGVRYDHERRTNVGYFDPPFAPIVNLDEAKSWSKVTPKFAIDFDVDPNTLVYASATKGFKSGSYSIGSNNPVVNPETVWAYEAGMKTSLFDRRLRLSLAAFWNDYKNLQVQKVDGISVITQNAASARIKGVEFSAVAAVDQYVQLNLDATYLDAKFTSFNSVNPVADLLPFPERVLRDAAGNPVLSANGKPFTLLDGNQLPGPPKLAINAGVQFTIPVANAANVVMRADVAYKSRVYFTEFNEAVQSQGGEARVNGSIQYNAADNKWFAGIWAKNLLNKTVVLNTNVTLSQWGYPLYGSYAPPRTFGVRAGTQF